MATTQELVSTLVQIGLTEKQAQVYLALLELESCTAYRIAEHCQVKKPTVYVVLEELRQKGLVLKVPHAKKALFAARDINEYLTEQKQKILAVESVAPQLQALGGAAKSNVYFYNGLRGIHEAFDYKFDSMRGKTFHSFYGNLAGASKEIKDFYSGWDKKAVFAGLRFQLVMPEEGRGKYYNDIIKLSEQTPDKVSIKFLKQFIFPPNISVEIADTFVRIFNDMTVQATIIDDIQTAQAFRGIFDIVWAKGV